MSCPIRDTWLVTRLKLRTTKKKERLLQACLLMILVGNYKVSEVKSNGPSLYAVKKNR